MRAVVIVLLFLATLTCWANLVEARDSAMQGLPQDSATLKLIAVCVVAESGWKNSLEHTAIAWALVFRARRRANGDHPATVALHTWQYCKGLRSSREWISTLLRTGRPPPGHEKRWAEVQSLILRWSRGEVRPTCENADHWGGRGIERDAKNIRNALDAGSMRVARCVGKTANTFLITRKEKK
jgi:hypothetical protein